MTSINKTFHEGEISIIPSILPPLMDQEKKMIHEFLAKFQQMDPLQQSNTCKYLSEMIERSSTAFLAKKQNQKVSVTFSYPSRGNPNDGNPALLNILELLHDKKLSVKENEYTKQRAIWLCEDFKVSWKPKNNHTILANALEQIGKL